MLDPTAHQIYPPSPRRPAPGYKYDAAADPGARALGTLSVEVVKARDLPVSEFGELPTTRCRIIVGGHKRGRVEPSEDLIDLIINFSAKK